MTVKFEHNKDSSVIGVLSEPVRLKGEEYDRLTIPALKGKQLRSSPFIAGSTEVPIGQLAEWANNIVEPVGIVDELSINDAMLVAAEVASALSKST